MTDHLCAMAQSNDCNHGVVILTLFEMHEVHYAVPTDGSDKSARDRVLLAARDETGNIPFEKAGQDRIVGRVPDVHWIERSYAVWRSAYLYSPCAWGIREICRTWNVCATR